MCGGRVGGEGFFEIFINSIFSLKIVICLSCCCSYRYTKYRLAYGVFKMLPNRIPRPNLHFVAAILRQSRFKSLTQELAVFEGIGGLRWVIGNLPIIRGLKLSFSDDHRIHRITGYNKKRNGIVFLFLSLSFDLILGPIRTNSVSISTN